MTTKLTFLLHVLTEVLSIELIFNLGLDGRLNLEILDSFPVYFSEPGVF